MYKCVNKQKILLVLVSLIGIIGAAFVVIGCGSGKGPQEKALNPAAGQFAVDFSNCPGILCRVVIDSATFTNDPNRSVGGKELTAEAWVKMNSADTGTFLARMGVNEGVALYVKAGNPKFAIRRVAPLAGDPGTGGCVNPHATSTECRVDSGETFGTPPLYTDRWHHIAGVLVNSDHSADADHIASANCAHATIGAETPHLDIYIDGVFKGCASANSRYADNPAGQIFTAGILSDTASDSSNLDGTIADTSELDGIVDEVRLWGTARTKAEIQACMNTELDLGGGTCGRMRSDLIAYFRLNEGKGASTTDWSGLLTGGTEMRIGGSPVDWTTGWVSGAPVSQKD